MCNKGHSIKGYISTNQLPERGIQDFQLSRHLSPRKLSLSEGQFVCRAVVQQVARGECHDVSVPVASFSFTHADACVNQRGINQSITIPAETISLEYQLFDVTLIHAPEGQKGCVYQLAYVVDEARPVPMLDDLHCPDSTASVQGEALAPAGNSVRVNSLPDPHSAPGIDTANGWNVRTRQMQFERFSRWIELNHRQAKAIGYVLSH